MVGGAEPGQYFFVLAHSLDRKSEDLVGVWNPVIAIWVSYRSLHTVCFPAFVLIVAVI